MIHPPLMPIKFIVFCKDTPSNDLSIIPWTSDRTTYTTRCGECGVDIVWSGVGGDVYALMSFNF